MTESDSTASRAETADSPTPLTLPYIGRLMVGGTLMGMANLIPGVSGGTMILAVGIYQEFIDAVAEVTALRFRMRTLIVLAIVGSTAAVAIAGLAGVILYLLFRHSSAMFALFIGLTLGGAPMLYNSIRPMSRRCILAVVAGIAVMAGIASLDQLATIPHNIFIDVGSGVAGAVTMVLPGISGSYILLVLGQYDRVIGAVDDLRHMNWQSLWILVPVGIGAVTGIAALSNTLKYLLHHHQRITVGVLLGMLLGSVLGLWPFDRPPRQKMLEKRTIEQLESFAQREGIALTGPQDHETCVEQILTGWQVRASDPYGTEKVATAIVALVIGLGTTTLLGRTRPGDSEAPDAADRC